MKLAEAVALRQCAKKHVDDPFFPGTHSVCRANISPGYYANFKHDDPARRSMVSTSMYYDFHDGIQWITSYAGEDGWEPDR